MKRLLIYSQDGTGLGHLRRSYNIAEEVMSQAPEVTVLIISDSPAVSLFARLPGMDYLKLPTIVKTGSASWRTEGLSLDIARTIKLRERLILEAFLEFRPDYVLIDHMPVGALGELKPMLDRATLGPWRPRLFLGLRDILGAPEVIRRVWADSGAYEYLERYEAVLIYGCREIYDAGSAYDLVPHAQRVVYCNYATSKSFVDPLVNFRTKRPFVLVMGGGGSDASRLANVFIDAFPVLLKKEHLHAVILTGPNMARTDCEQLVARAASYPVEVKTGYHDARTWIHAATAVVSMAGYNSLCETLNARKKTLVVPRSGPSAEQQIRSRLLAQHNVITALDPEDLMPDRLGEKLMRLLSEDRIPDLANIPPLNGTQRAASFLFSTRTTPKAFVTVPRIGARP